MSFEDNSNDHLQNDQAYTRLSRSPATTRVASPVVRERTASPMMIPSPVGGSSQTLSSGGGGGRLRISREEVKKRMMRERSGGSMSPSPGGGVEGGEKNQEREGEGMRDGARDRDEESVKDESMEKDRDGMSSVMTDLSTEMATIETVERRLVGDGGWDVGGVEVEMESTKEGKEKETEFGLLQASLGQSHLMVDLGSKFGLGGLGIGGMGMGGSTSSRVSKMREGEVVVKMGVGHEVKMSGGEVGGPNGSNEVTGMTMGDVDVDMKSALDRLMDDVAGTRVDDSVMSEGDGESYDTDRYHARGKRTPASIPRHMERAATDSALLGNGGGNGFVSRTVSGSSIAPAVPPKDNIKSREEMIIEKRREARRRDEDESLGYYTPPRIGEGSGRHLSVGRPSRRRSMSTGDAEVLGGGAKRRGAAMRGGDEGLLDVVPQGVEEDPLGDSIEKELRNLEGPHKRVCRFTMFCLFFGF